jgi:hypothetical protein
MGGDKCVSFVSKVSTITDINHVLVASRVLVDKLEASGHFHRYCDFANLVL